MCTYLKSSYKSYVLKCLHLTMEMSTLASGNVYPWQWECLHLTVGMSTLDNGNVYTCQWKCLHLTMGMSTLDTGNVYTCQWKCLHLTLAMSTLENGKFHCSLSQTVEQVCSNKLWHRSANWNTCCLLIRLFCDIATCLTMAEAKSNDTVLPVIGHTSEHFTQCFPRSGLHLPDTVVQKQENILDGFAVFICRKTLVTLNNTLIACMQNSSILAMKYCTITDLTVTEYI